MQPATALKGYISTDINHVSVGQQLRTFLLYNCKIYVYSNFKMIEWNLYPHFNYDGPKTADSNQYRFIVWSYLCLPAKFFLVGVVLKLTDNDWWRTLFWRRYRWLSLLFFPISCFNWLCIVKISEALSLAWDRPWMKAFLESSSSTHEMSSSIIIPIHSSWHCICL